MPATYLRLRPPKVFFYIKCSLREIKYSLLSFHPSYTMTKARRRVTGATYTRNASRIRWKVGYAVSYPYGSLCLSCYLRDTA